MKTLKSKLALGAITVGAVLFSSGLAAFASPTGATGKTTANNYYGLLKAYSGDVNLLSPEVALADSKAIQAFCIEPNATLVITDSYDVTAVGDTDLNATAKASGDGFKRARFLLNHVTWYAKPFGDKVGTTYSGTDVTQTYEGTRTDHTSKTGVIGTPITTGVNKTPADNHLDVPAPGATDPDIFPVDMEYAAFQAAIRKLIDPATDLDAGIVYTDATAKSLVSTRAKELVSLANAANLADIPAAGPYGVEINPKAVTSDSGTTITASFSGLASADGAVSNIDSGDVTITTTDTTLDLDPKTDGIQASVAAKVASGKLVDASGAVGVTIAKPAADAEIVITLAKAIAPGTILKTTQTGTTTAAQQLGTADWASVAAKVTATSAVTPDAGSAPSTTAPTKLPMSGPVTSLPLLIGGAFIGALGLWLRRRPA